jgi:hypothetical protein
VVREVEAGQQLARAAAKLNRIRTAGGRNVAACHLLVTIPAGMPENKTNNKCFK